MGADVLGGPAGSGGRGTSRACLYILVGLPGAGKSTYARKHLAGAVRICPDDIRLMMSGRAYEPNYEPIVWTAVNVLLETLLAEASRGGFDLVFDATNTTRARRHDIVAVAREHGVEPVCVFFDVPLHVARDRNARRRHVVPEQVMLRFYRQLERPGDDEGFARIVVVTS